MNRVYTVLEYSNIIRGKTLPNNVFDNLEKFILSNSNLIDFMNISIKKGFGKVITIKNYVGVICTNDGSTIEILPKICNTNDIKHTRRIFINMLKSTKDIPFKTIQKGYIKVDSISMLDIFINEFLNSLEAILLYGIASKYVNISESSTYLRGKIDYSKQYKNAIYKNRFFITHETFTIDNPENRLIKSTLLLLKKTTYSTRIQKILSYFDTILPSKDYLKDFSNCNIKSYEEILKWCKVFLMDNGFTPFADNFLTYALLFPMQKVFEDYVANLVKKSVSNYEVRIQSKEKYLIDVPRKFSLIPDIVLHNDTNTIILDTKWKLLDINSKNYGISQQDMYQMYAYAKKYESNRVILVYPLSDENFKSKDIIFKTDDITIEVRFIEL